MITINLVNIWEDLFLRRIERIAKWRKFNGGLGMVNQPMACFLFCVSRQRIDQLLSEGRLKSIGYEGFRLVPVRSLLELAKAGYRQKSCRRQSANTSIASGRGFRLGV